MEPAPVVSSSNRERTNRNSLIRRSNSLSSSSNARRQTRSLHSDQLADEVPTDEDAVRWAETIRQRRLSRKKRIEDEDAVLVGTRVSEGHTNWVTAYNMLTGIRVATSRCNAKVDRELTALDFNARHKLAFDIQGNELTPSARYDFKFKDYAPWVFRDLRRIFQIDAADYLVSLTGKYILSELGSPGKSGSFFYFSRDYRFIIKTLHHAEHKFLRKMLPQYHSHTKKYPNTLISQFYGLHRVKTSFGKKIHFVVMNNLFPPHMDIHSTYDVKGSTVGRITTEDDKKGNPRGTLKDLNWLNSKQYLKFSADKKVAFLEQVQRDVELLAMLKIMDYSLLLGVHNMTEASNSAPLAATVTPEAQTSTAKVPSSPAPLLRTPSVSGQNYRHRDLRRMVTPREGPVTLSQLSNSHTHNASTSSGTLGTSSQNITSIDGTIHEAHAAPLTAILSGEPVLQQSVGMQHNIFYQFEGGIRSQDNDGTPGDIIYFLGIIDLLTNYGPRKRLENFFKGLGRSEDIKKQISAVPPERYASRFRDFVSAMTKSPSEVEKARLQRTPSAINLENAVQEMKREHIGPQTPEPETTLTGVQSQASGDVVLPVVAESPREADSEAAIGADDLVPSQNVSDKRRRTSGTQRERLQEVADLQEARRASLDEMQGTPHRRGSIASMSSEPVLEENEADGHDSGVATSLDCLPEESEPSRQSSLSRTNRHEISRLSTIDSSSQVLDDTVSSNAKVDLAPPLQHEDFTTALYTTYTVNGTDANSKSSISLSTSPKRKLSAEERALRRRGVIETSLGDGVHVELQRRASASKASPQLDPERFEDEGYGEMTPEESPEPVA